MVKDFCITPIKGLSGMKYTKSDIKIITNALETKEDEPYKYLYILDLRNDPCKALMGSVYPWFCLWTGCELSKSDYPIQPDIYKDLFGEDFDVNANYNKYRRE